MKLSTQRLALLSAATCVAVGSLAGSVALAAPYASGVVRSGTNVSFVLNEAADLVQVTFPGGGAPITIDATTKGTKSFNLPSAGAAFNIYTRKNSATGYTIPNGAFVFASANGLSQISSSSDAVFLSDDSVLYRFANPRGIDVVKNANAVNFGNTYVSNSTPATTTGVIRNVGRGIYAQKADGSDAYGYGETAQASPDWTVTPATANTPFKVTTGPDGSVYVTGFGDLASNVWRMSPNLTTVGPLFAGNTGPSPLPEGQNHGSISSVHVEGGYGNNLTVYTLDEDMAGDRFTPGTGPTGLNNLWRYNLGAATGPVADAPTRINQESLLLNLATSDVNRGKDGKFYVTQNRNVGTEAGVFVLDANGVKLYDSLTDSRTLVGDQAAPDILRNLLGVAISPDQKYLAGMLNVSDVVVVPLVNGIPDLANRLVIDTGTDVASGRDIAFDAVGNIHYVSSGQGFYRVLSPGGFQQSLLKFNGTSFDFSATLPGDYNRDGAVNAADYTVWADSFGGSGSADGNGDGVVDAADYTVWADNFGQGALPSSGPVSVPEPASMGLAAAAALGLLARRRR